MARKQPGTERGARAPRHDPDWEPPIPGRRRVIATWDDYMDIAKRVVGRFHDRFDLRHFDYWHPEQLQRKVAPRFRKRYPVKVAYTDWGDPDRQTVVCCGGVANTAMRFNYLAADLSDKYRVVCMDWVGRGRSAWMADEKDYSLGTYVEQLKQLIEHLGGRPVILLGSSLGGSAAIELVARYPNLVDKLILNDIGPFIPKKRRKRRSQTLARHYVFRDPGDLLRKIGASQKNDGPISDDIRFNVTFHQTRWSDEDGGRVYRHDVRALQAYREDAKDSLDQWKHWRRIKCPVMLIHGMLSDALLPMTIKKMKASGNVTLMHVPDTGHTPVLSDRNQNWFIHEWLVGSAVGGCGEWTVLHAKPRKEQPHNIATLRVA
ncbi:alpha/beta fold hydrolase [Usitatibacter palustris]|uniref:2-succinyl-6-hydroxy-2, 4-cyclohexadiene-1-carboxylate synthase n=1 Tax=Usitatibacter palustris TaxID=2732487 RepID=A0A6M4HC31_9PROT|nr:alpha/beta hydrolase [Usitatibacter palustris]QJR16802.1 2-succinyl-6-hydroxy-2,4-cyclohexadiene-1-carboxylate synthase [Usitatibacter palustris]